MVGLVLLFSLSLCCATRGVGIAECGNWTEEVKYCKVTRKMTDTWDEAQEHCRSFGDNVGLPQDKTEEEHQDLLHIMKDLHLETMWLALRWKELGNWTWINGDIVLSPVSGRTRSGCGQYALKDEHISWIPCFLNTPVKFICLHTDEVCPRSVARYNCAVVNGGSVTLHDGVNDWFTARALCRAQRAELMHSVELAKHTITRLFPIYERGEFLVGLHQEDWAFIHPFENETAMGNVYWDKQQPSQQNLSCARLSGSSGMWNIVSCSDRHSYICEIFPQGTYRTVQPTANATTQETSPTQSSSEIIPGVYLTFLCVLFPLLVVVAFVSVLGGYKIGQNQKIRAGILNHHRRTLGETTTLNMQDFTHSSMMSVDINIPYYSEVKDPKAVNCDSLVRANHRAEWRSKRISRNPFNFPISENEFNQYSYVSEGPSESCAQTVSFPQRIFKGIDSPSRNYVRVPWDNRITDDNALRLSDDSWFVENETYIGVKPNHPPRHGLYACDVTPADKKMYSSACAPSVESLRSYDDGSVMVCNSVYMSRL